MTTESSKAVFLSYASQDAEAARHIADALRAAGVEVWFDQSELRGGDVWDQQIRRQIRDCALFIPIISANTQARPEGYFRLEWRLAEQRTHLMGRIKAFIVPICVDDTAETEADVPDSFSAAQWTRLTDGDTPPAFVERVARLLSPQQSTLSVPPHATVGPMPASAAASSNVGASRPVLLLMATAALIAIGYFTVNGLVVSKRVAEAGRASAASVQSIATAQSAIPEKSIAVLPFADMSEKKDQEYFSDGLAEDVLDQLAKTRGLAVIARTSSFYFKGRQATITEIANTLKAANILEGSVRKAGDTIRVTTQLIRASDGVDLWSETYDRKLDDLFKVQDDIASAVVKALKMSLLSQVPSATGATHNPEANDLFLRAQFIYWNHGDEDTDKAIALLRRTLELAPTHAKAWALLSRSLGVEVMYAQVTAAKAPDTVREARRAALKAVALAPNLPDTHIALGRTYNFNVDGPDYNKKATAEFRRALELDPQSADALDQLGDAASTDGRRVDAVRLYEQALAIDPLNVIILGNAGVAYLNNDDPQAALKILRKAEELHPGAMNVNLPLGNALAITGQSTEALKYLERAALSDEDRKWARALLYPSLGRAADAASLLAELERNPGSYSPLRLAEIYAFRGDRDRALQWLARVKPHEADQWWFVEDDPWLQPLRGDPRYAALMRQWNLPH